MAMPSAIESVHEVVVYVAWTMMTKTKKYKRKKSQDANEKEREREKYSKRRITIERTTIVLCTEQQHNIYTNTYNHSKRTRCIHWKWLPMKIHELYH